MNKVFITGISGLLGANIARTLPEHVQVLGCYNGHAVDFKKANIRSVKLDLVDAAATRAAITAFKPDTIIHCAALTNVDWCQTHPQETHTAHVTVTETITAIARELGSTLVYISTEAVFDGKRGNYTEQDTPNPINTYSQTKLLAEKAALAYPRTIALRTTMYGWNVQDKKSLAEWMIGNFQAKQQMNGFTDTFFAPVLVNRFARIIEYLCTKNIYGIINIGSTDQLSKYDFALLIADIFGFDKSLVVPKTSDQVLTVPRPQRTALAVGYAQKLGVPLTTVREDLVEMKRLLDSGAVAELKQAKAH